MEKALRNKGKKESEAVGFSGPATLRNAELSFLIDEYNDLEVHVRSREIALHESWENL